MGGISVKASEKYTFYVIPLKNSEDRCLKLHGLTFSFIGRQAIQKIANPENPIALSPNASNMT